MVLVWAHLPWHVNSSLGTCRFPICDALSSFMCTDFPSGIAWCCVLAFLVRALNMRPLCTEGLVMLNACYPCLWFQDTYAVFPSVPLFWWHTSISSLNTLIWRIDISHGCSMNMGFLERQQALTLTMTVFSLSTLTMVVFSLSTLIIMMFSLSILTMVVVSLSTLTMTVFYLSIEFAFFFSPSAQTPQGTVCHKRCVLNKRQ